MFHPGGYLGMPKGNYTSINVINWKSANKISSFVKYLLIIECICWLRFKNTADFFLYSQCGIIISHDSLLTLGMTGSFGGFMPGSMGGGSPFGSMQVGHRNNCIKEQNPNLDLQSCDIMLCNMLLKFSFDDLYVIIIVFLFKTYIISI